MSALFVSDTGLAVASVDETPIVWNTQTGQQLFTLTGHTAPVLTAAWSPDGSTIATAGEDTNVMVWNAATGESLLTLSGHKDPIYSVAFSPDGSRVASSGFDQTVRIWDVATGEPLLTLEQPAWSKGVAFTPDGTRIAAGTDRVGTEGYLRVRVSLTGELQLDIPVGNTRTATVAFSPDGTHIVVRLLEGVRAEVRNAETGELVRTLSGSANRVAGVAGVAYSPEGTHIATSSSDATLLWDATSGEQLFTLYSSPQGAARVAFSPDGRYLATQNQHGTTRIYHVHVEDLIALAESRLTRTLTEAECQRYLHTDTRPQLPDESSELSVPSLSGNEKARRLH